MRRIPLPVALAAALTLAGCVTYSEKQVAAMSSYDVCEALAEQRMNLTAESERALRKRVETNKIACERYNATIEARRAEELYDRTYRNQSP